MRSGFDMTARGGEDRSFRKSIDGYTVLGPWMITADELPNPADVPFTLHVNDEKRQDSNTSFLIFDIPKLIEFASKFYTLYPGDLYYTGTPEGVGPVKPGDWVRMNSLPQLGELKIQVRAHQIMIGAAMIKVLRVGHATFTTPDIERQVAYYSDVLGLIVTERDKNRAFLATRTGLEAIALERGDKPDLTRLSFQVAPDADFAAYCARTVGARHQERAAQRHFAGRCAGAGLHRRQGHGDRTLFRLRVRQGRRQAGGRHAAQARSRRAPRRPTCRRW